ncbi:protein RGF1 INDUCIBLE TRANSCRIPTION FACTOR 1-like [Aristolochia californica]|uniref:protein RGF1 INDUCIBLE TRANSCRIPTION FACTOR 1-like n=1 Tax=Aristolochia californica TaxID=171875 RepID=UPI0035DA128D
MVGFASRQRIKNKWPAWLEKLLKSKFFGSCLEHENFRKNEINIFCVDCALCICQHCLASSHHRHKIVQIRRYVYHDVILLHVIQKLLDCSKVQPYTINRAKAVFLNPRSASKPAIKSNGGAVCENCDRCLMEPYRYCSVACKAEMATEMSRPFFISGLADLTSFPSNEENSSIVSLPPCSPPPCSPNSSEESDPWLNSLKPKKQLHKRKGIPRRSPVF